MRLARLAIATTLALASCEVRAPRSPAHEAPADPALQGAPKGALPWATFDARTFERAKRERKFVLLDGSAEWCHFCHVMEAETYHDPAVRAFLDAHFITVKVDVDARPDLEERYGAWGWPATVVFSPDAVELAKYRGYIEKARFLALMKGIVEAGAGAEAAPAASARPARTAHLSNEELAWITEHVEIELDDYYDDVEGGWGRTQKAPLGWNNAWLLRLAARGDGEARKKVLFTLEQQSKLVDPVWGGIYQYSAASDWDHAHYEKLMTFQAPALENWAEAWRLTRDPRQRARALAMRAYVDRFLTGPDGGFYTTQDADLNAHDHGQPFMTGHAYYLLPEKERLVRGIPRIDTSEYGRENGLAIAAYVTASEALGDRTLLATAERAARRVLEGHTTGKGAISHARTAVSDFKILYLADNAAFGFALVRLWEATKNPAWLDAARRLAEATVAEMKDTRTGGLFASSKDPDAAGVFAERRVPVEDNAMALRMFARLYLATKAAPALEQMEDLLVVITTPQAIRSRGRFLGEILLALDDARLARSTR